MELKKTQFICEDHIGYITMNCPQNLNAVDEGMAEELFYLLEQCEADPQVKVVVLRGGEKAFSAGGDIAFFYDKIQRNDLGDINSAFDKVGKIALKIKQMGKMVVTSVKGAAAGAGANLALAGDFVIAADNVKFIQAFVNLGLAPDTGGAYLLCKTIGAARAMDLCATGRPLAVDEAQQLGLVKLVCPKDELAERTAEFAKKLAAGPLFAYANIKKQIFAAAYSDYEHYLTQVELPTQCACGATEDFKEGVCAFMEKRKANFQGK